MATRAKRKTAAKSKAKAKPKAVKTPVKAKSRAKPKAGRARKSPPKPKFKAALWRHGELPFITCEAGPGQQSTIARVINKTNSRHIGGGYEIMDRICVHWTVLYDEVLFIHEGHIDIVTDQGRFECGPGDVVWLPEGTELDYDASKGRCGFFYALYPFDWAARHGMKEP
jgi:ethanolamine utilization protein EutQ